MSDYENLKKFSLHSSLAKLITGETIAGFISAASVAPIIAMVDQSIFSSASGREPMLKCLKREIKLFVTKPNQFIKQPSFHWILAVYSATYIVANNFESLYTRFTNAQKNVAVPKFVATSATNVGMSTVKDRAFAQMFGALDQVAKKPTMSTLSLFALRDTITVLSSFTLVNPIAVVAQDKFHWTEPTAKTIAQLVTPCAAQLVNTPWYLLGLSLYNQPQASTSAVLQFMKGHYWKTVFARFARIGPAFSIGGVLNTRMRRALHKTS